MEKIEDIMHIWISELVVRSSLCTEFDSLKHQFIKRRKKQNNIDPVIIIHIAITLKIIIIIHQSSTILVS